MPFLATDTFDAHTATCYNGAASAAQPEPQPRTEGLPDEEGIVPCTIRKSQGRFRGPRQVARITAYQGGAKARGERGGAELDLVVRTDSNGETGRSRYRLRLSMRAKLTLGVLVAALPMLIAAIWLAWDTPFLGMAAICGLCALGLGLGLIIWANRPLADLAERSRTLAGLSTDRQHLVGLIRTDPPGDEAIAAALDRIEKSLQEIQALNRIGQLVASEEDLRCILSAIAEEAVGLLQADAGLIGSWDAENEVFRDVAACNLPIMFPGREFGARESLSSQVAKSGKTIFVEDYVTYPYRIPELERFQLRAGLGVPLMVGEQCRGTLSVHTVDPDRHFTAREGELLITFASQAGAAFEKARLYQLALDQLEELRVAREELARESQGLERALSNMVRVQEEERSRIAADVHDGVVQMMVGSLCELQAAMAHFPRELEMVDAKQQRARALIRDSITELRRVIFDLRPIILDTAGLIPAVQSLVGDLQQISEERLDLYVVGAPCRFLPEAEIGAYRIIQEALNNAIKHSEATAIDVYIRFADGTLHIEVSDDGKGFSVEDVTSIYDKKAGLIGMKERARSLGGRLAVSSARGQGTMVTSTIPCKPCGSVERRDVSRLEPCADPLVEELVQVGEDDCSR